MRRFKLPKETTFSSQQNRDQVIFWRAKLRFTFFSFSMEKVFLVSGFETDGQKRRRKVGAKAERRHCVIFKIGAPRLGSPTFSRDDPLKCGSDETVI